MQSELLTATHDIGWQGLLLRVPLEWNLSAFGGTAKKGWLAISDLRAVRLMARWRKGNGATFQSLAAKLQRRGAECSRQENALQANLTSGEKLVLAHDGRRIIELQWPERPSRDADDCLMQAFLERLRERPALWEWKFFGVAGSAPPYARVGKTALLAGAPRITLSVGSTVHTLGAFSMADRHLEHGTLNQAAAKLLRLDALPGEWGGTDGSGLLFHGTISRRLWRPRICFRFVISHDAEANLIRWNLTTRRGFHRIWKQTI